MRDRVCLILDVPANRTEEVARSLSKRSGVSADILGDRAEVKVVIEANDRQRLAIRVFQTLSTVKDVTMGIRLLPVENQTEIRLAYVM